MPITAILQVGEVQDLGLDLQREIFMLSHPRATSPIDFSIHALEILTREGYDCPTLTLKCLAPNREAVGTIFNVFSMTRPGREPDTSSTEYGDAVTEPYP